MSDVTIKVKTDVGLIDETTRTLKIYTPIEYDRLTNPDYFENNMLKYFVT